MNTTSQLYYIDEMTDTIKMTTAPDMVKFAYKGIFIDNFRRMKEYLEYGYQSHYDLEWGLYSAPEFGLKEAYEISTEIERLDEYHLKFVQEYTQLGYSLLAFIQSEEWKKRRLLNQEYIDFYGQHRFIGQEYKDRLLKNIYKKNQYDFIRIRSKYGRSREVQIQEQAKDVFSKLDNELLQEKESIMQNQIAVGAELRRVQQSYVDLQKSSQLPLKRADDIKNILIIYLSQREILERKLKACELAISTVCKTPDVKGKIVSLQDLEVSDVRYKAGQGYNVYLAKDGSISQVVYIGYGLHQDRLCALSKDLKMCRNLDRLVIDLAEDVGEPLHIQGTFFDKEEHTITDNEVALESAVNPILTLFYPDKFESDT